MDLSRTTTRSAIVAGVALALLLAGCGAQDTESATDGESRPSSVPPSVGDDAATSASGRERGDPARGTRSEQEARQPGQYVELADYLADPSIGGDDAVVIFFHAPWCPDCVATDASLRSDGVPDGLTVVKADFDTETDLRARYGVTVQHSFVQLDGDEAVRAWTGSRTGADIAAELG